MLGTYWYLMVSEQTCTIDHKMDQSMWQTIISFDLLHPSYMWIQTVIVMWETLPNNSDWECFKTPILQEILRIHNLHQVEHCAFLVVIHLFRKVGCVRNKLQFHTVQQNQKSFPWTQDWVWTAYPHLIYGIWSSQFFTETRIRVIKNGETCVRTYVRFVQHLTQFKNERNLMEWLIWTMLIVFPQTSNLLTRKLCCMCLKTTKHWSRWFSREEARQWDMFPELTELPLIGWSIESIGTPKSKSNTLTPKTNSKTYWLGEISHVMNGNIFCVCLTLAISVLPIVLKWCRKERKKIQVKKESLQNRSWWWIWSRDAAKGILTCLPPLHHKAGWKPDMKVKIPLSSWNEQQPRTVRPVKDAYSSSYSEWNGDENWSSQEWKSDEVMEVRTERLVNEQPPSLFAQHTDRFIVDDDDLDSNTVTESDMSLKSRSFLHRVNDRVRKMLDQASKDATQDSNKHSWIWWMFMSSTLQTSVLMGKNYLENFHSIKNTGNNLTMKQMFDISEKLIVGQSDVIYGVNTINWDDSSLEALKDKKLCPSRSRATATQTLQGVCWAGRARVPARSSAGNISWNLRQQHRRLSASRVLKLNSTQQSRQRLRELVAFQWCEILE